MYTTNTTYLHLWRENRTKFLKSSKAVCDWRAREVVEVEINVCGKKQVSESYKPMKSESFETIKL